MATETTPLIKRIIVSGYFLIVCSLVLLFWNWSNLPPELPWFYSLPWGEGQLIKKTYLVVVFLVEFFVWSGINFWSIKNKREGEELLVSVLLGILVSIGIVLVSELKIMRIFL